MKSIVGKDLTDGEARELFMLSRREMFRRGDHVFNEGEEANALFLIAHGEVDIRKKLADGSQHSLAVHPVGAVIGEMSLLTREIRSATAVVTSSEATILRVTAKDLDELLEREPTTAYKLMFALARVLAGRLKAINHRLADMSSRTVDSSPHEQIEEFQAFKRKLFSDWSF
ncbi:MAG TPA: cyclic nucleotide-binding domain-containing protein [Archangium sp.]